MSKKLAKNVQVGDTVYMAGETVDKDIADQITNPRAWEADDPADADADADEAKPAAKKAAAAKKS